MNKIIYIKLEWLIVFFKKVLLLNELIVFLVILTISLQVTSHLARASSGQILIMKEWNNPNFQFSIVIIEDLWSHQSHWKFVLSQFVNLWCQAPNKPKMKYVEITQHVLPTKPKGLITSIISKTITTHSSS